MKQSSGKALRSRATRILPILRKWGFQHTRDRYGTLWIAPPLAQLRTNIAKKYPAIKWYETITEWGPDTVSALKEPSPAAAVRQCPEDIGDAGDADAMLDELVRNLEGGEVIRQAITQARADCDLLRKGRR